MENTLHTPFSLRRIARWAGLIDLIWILTGLFSLLYLPTLIYTGGDATTAAQNILSNEFLFRASIMIGLLGTVLWVLLVLLLYRLFLQVGEYLAKLMVVLVLIQLPVGFIEQALNITSLMILKDQIALTFNSIQQQDIALLLISMSKYMVIPLELFWGLWLFPLGLLVFRSHFLPRFLGIWLIVNGVAYVILSIVTLLLPQYKDLVFKIMFPAMFGELAFMLWLVIKGVKTTFPTAVIPGVAKK